MAHYQAPKDKSQTRGSRGFAPRLLDLLLVYHKKETGLETRTDLFLFKSRMIILNFIANSIGVFVMRLVMYGAGFRPAEFGFGVISNFWFLIMAPFPFFIGAYLMIRYERPIWRCVEAVFHKSSVSEETLAKAKRRVLNEPFYNVLLHLGLWLLAGMTFALIYWMTGQPAHLIPIPLFAGLNSGLIISAYAFFFTEHVVQYHTIPYIFPEGDVSGVVGAHRIRIATRLVALMLAINVVPFIAQIQLLQMFTYTYPEIAVFAQPIRTAMTTSALVFISVGLLVTLQAGINMSIPFHDIMVALDFIRKGRFEHRVQVTSNDEIGYTAEAINEMARGLEERERMRRSLNLAREVQQNLLPAGPPEAAGLDIAGRSVFCDETGGDYYDYMRLGGEDSQKTALFIGDVSDHGLQAALLMISARAYLRHHVYHVHALGAMITEVNMHMVHDVKDTGRFMTLFVAVIDAANKTIHWVRAGHDPGFLYDPALDCFEELGGTGLSLGIQEDSEYEEFSCGLESGQVIVLATDGVWEARNRHGEPFGKGRLMEAIRAKADNSAEDIMHRIWKDLRRFTGSSEYQDDVTVIVAKVLD